MKSGLIIREPWINLILSGEKTWEMRSRATSVRGRIALIQQGAGLVVGTARLIDSKPPLTRENYMAYREKHAIPPSMLDQVLANRWVYPWVLSEVRRLPKPVPYRHRSGAVTFVTLDPAIVDAIANQSVDDTPSDKDAASSREHTWFTDPPPRRAVRPPASAEHAESCPASDSSTNPLFVFRPEKAQAYGRPLADGDFLVLAGSTAMRRGSPKVKRNADDRDRLIRQGVLLPDADPDLYRFATDHAFSSCSKAAGVIKDGNASGPSLWKDVKTGTTLKGYLKRSPCGSIRSR